MCVLVHSNAWCIQRPPLTVRRLRILEHTDLNLLSYVSLRRWVLIQLRSSLLQFLLASLRWHIYVFDRHQLCCSTFL